MYSIHPLTTHLPIGLLIGNALLTLLFLRRRDPSLETAAYHCLWLGTLLLVPSAATGTYEAVRQLFGEAARNDALNWINGHAVLGIATLIVYWQAWLQRRRDPAILAGERRNTYLGTLALGVVLMVAAGWVGGHMVYALGVGVER